MAQNKCKLTYVNSMAYTCTCAIFDADNFH